MQTGELQASPIGKRKYGRPLLLLVGAAIVFVALALGLGLGLGLGLKHHHHAASSSTSGLPPSSNPANVSSTTATGAVQSWRRDTAEYNLDMNWDMNAAPTTRVFNLTVSEIQAAPDGVLTCPSYSHG
jgi:hypothetical protein